MTTGGRVLSGAAKKARLARAFVGGEPVHCTWQLSPRCESFCHFCEHRAESAGEELDTAGCAAVSAALGSRSSLLVSFTGSEPFLRDDLAAIVAATAARHFPLLVTNGWLVSPARARAVWEAGLEAATVSMEDALPEGHDAVTGVPGSHARAVSALETLVRERTRRTQRVNVRTRLRGADLDAAGEGAGAGFPLGRDGDGGGGLPPAGAERRRLGPRVPAARAGAAPPEPAQRASGARGDGPGDERRRDRVPGRPRLLQRRPPRPGERSASSSAGPATGWASFPRTRPRP